MDNTAAKARQPSEGNPISLLVQPPFNSGIASAGVTEHQSRLVQPRGQDSAKGTLSREINLAETDAI